MPENLFHFIAGDFYEGTPVRVGQVVNPATEMVIRHVPYASTVDVDYATTKAQTAFLEWATTPPAARAKILLKWQHLIEQLWIN